MGDDILGALVGFGILAFLLVLFITAMTVAIPVTVVLGGGYLGWKWYNNSPATQTRRQMDELRELYDAIGTKLRLAGTSGDADAIVREAADRAEYIAGRPVPAIGRVALEAGAKDLLSLSGAGSLPRFDRAALEANEQLRSEFRLQLYAIDETHQYGSNPGDVYAEYLGNALGEILYHLPEGVDFDDDNAPLTTRLIDMMPNGKEIVGTVFATPYHVENGEAALKPLILQLEQRLANIAQKSVEELQKNPHRVPKPVDDPRPAAEVAMTYLAGSPFLPVLMARISYALPDAARMEHMHVLAGSGHGKTQFLQSFIKADLDALVEHVEYPDLEAPRSVVVIDSQGDLIHNILTRKVFAPGEPLADRLVLVDPTDLSFPPALNMFDVGQDTWTDMKPGDRARVYNGTIELYVYLFSELLEANLTTRQATLFRYLAQLLLVIPNATLHTFRAALNDDEDCMAHVSQLDPIAQQFFATEYLGDDFKSVKKEMSWRLWSLISNPSLAAMFNADNSKIDLDAQLQRGAVILINTARGDLQSANSKLFGRFWVALVAQAAIKRANIAKSKRVTTHVYLDEAHEIVDSKVEEILNQARKYKIGLCISHQNLGQLRDNATRASVAASTAIKVIGGASDKDATAFAADVRATPEQILATKKIDRVHSEFVCFVKNHMDAGITLTVPHGQLEDMPKSDRHEMQEMRDANRDRYCYKPGEPPSPPPEPERPEPVDAMARSSNDEPAYEFKLGDPEDL